MITQLIKKIFDCVPSEKECLILLENVVYPEGVTCSRCNKISESLAERNLHNIYHDCSGYISLLSQTLFRRYHIEYLRKGFSTVIFLLNYGLDSLYNKEVKDIYIYFDNTPKRLRSRCAEFNKLIDQAFIKKDISYQLIMAINNLYLNLLSIQETEELRNYMINYNYKRKKYTRKGDNEKVKILDQEDKILDYMINYIK